MNDPMQKETMRNTRFHEPLIRSRRQLRKWTRSWKRKRSSSLPRLALKSFGEETELHRLCLFLREDKSARMLVTRIPANALKLWPIAAGPQPHCAKRASPTESRIWNVMRGPLNGLDYQRRPKFTVWRLGPQKVVLLWAQMANVIPSPKK